jgi:prophage antirepressor-like protein
MEINKNSNFFLDVFNNILDYNNSKVIIIFDINGDIWFGLKDLFKMLGYDAMKAITRFEIDNKYKCSYEKILKRTDIVLIYIVINSNA